MTPRNRYVHDMLCALYDHPAMRGSSASGHTILSKLIAYGPMGAAQPGPTTPMELPSDLLGVRDAVNNLDYRHRCAVELTYGAGYPVEVVAREVHESHTVVRALLKDSRPLIAAFLSGRGFRVPKDENC